MTLKISISGVRGTVPDALTPEICLDFAKAFGTYLNSGTVAIGTDSRPSSEFIKGIVFSGLLSTGCSVIDLGICPTPTVGIMIRETKASGGMVITASHNPLPWNGLKFMREDGIFLNEAQAKHFLKIYESKPFKHSASQGVKIDLTGIDTHIRKVMKVVNASAIRRNKLRVAIDGCNGAGSVALVKLLEKLGCKVIPINCNPRLPFPHDPEPIPENLSELVQTVKTKRADLGFAVDSDADRLSVVSEEGRAIGEELTLALAIKFILKKNLGLSSKSKIVVTNLSTSQVIDDIARQYGARVIRTKIGEVHVAEELKNLRGLIGGEGNGGVIYPQIGFNRDSLTAIALILNYLAASKEKLSTLVSEMPHYEILKTKIECKNLDEANDFIDKTKNLFKGEDLILTEGVKVILSDAWIHVRASNTEPVIRIIAEARERQKAEALIRKVLS